MVSLMPKHPTRDDEADLNLKIRSVQAGDVDEIFAVLESARLGSKVSIGPTWSHESIAEECRQSGLCLMRERIDAFILWRDNGVAWEISFLATRSELQGLGFMSHLLRAMIRDLAGGRVIWLEVHAGNRPAISLYEKLGFKRTGERKSYYADGGSALNMTFDAASAAVRFNE